MTPHDPLRAKYDDLRIRFALKESVIEEQRKIIEQQGEKLTQLEAENAKLRLYVQALRNSLRLNAETILKLSEDIVRLKGGEA